jgi:hypothetical protein
MRHLRTLSGTALLMTCLGLWGCGSDNGTPSHQDAAVDTKSTQPTPDAPSTPSDVAVTPIADANPIQPTVDSGSIAQLDTGSAASEAGAASLDAGSGTSEAGVASVDVGGTPDTAVASLTIRGIVAAHSDYQSASISLLDRDGKVVKDDCINSGTGGSGLLMTLSGDIALPSQISATSPITLIDRSYAALTWIDPVTCAPLRQLAVGTGFKANPHDYVEISTSKAYVTRYAQNAAPTASAGDFDEGNDLLIVDPTQAKITGRIDLAPSTPTGVLPRADRAMLVEGKVFVSLNASNAKYGANATGRLVIVDPTLDQVVGTVDLPGTKNCGAMAYVPASMKLLVACTGDYGDANQADASAVVALSVATNPPTVIGKVGASAVGGLIFSNSAVAALDGDIVLGVTMGDFSNTPPDKLWLLPQDGSAPSKVFDSTEAYSMGAVLVDAERGRVFLTDGTTLSAASVRVFDRVDGELQATTTIKTNPTQKLPARALAWF